MKFTKTFSLIGVFLIIASCKNGSKNGEHNMNETKLHEFSNDLVNETSPYLLQHAHNPVNWKPWSDNAFNNAITENRLIVLSIGYSTCHWCHVMEEESFEDVEVAKLMNEKFVSIKVDREERPDVDMVYQTALQLVNGTGGWPMNAILLPDGSPVYLGTYSAKEDWKAILNQFSAEFQKNPIKMKEYATMLANGVQEVYEQPVKQLATKVTATKISNGIEAWSASWDEEWGGNVGQQKFIIPTNLKMLLEYSTLQQEEKIKRFVFKTLNKVSQGGIYDHIGGGFFRYSTDARWKVPHFEKMLYDNAQMMSLLSKAYSINGSKEYRSMVDETFTFLKTEMRNEEGGYFSAMDADTNGEEGLYYVWKKKELRSIIGDDFKLFSKFYEIKNSEVWENSSFVLFNTLTAAEFSEQAAISEAELYSKLATWKTKLYNARQLRQKPAKDYKIITSWNALLIDGLVDAYKSFADDKYLLEAISIFDYLKSNNYSDNRLVHSYTTDSKQKEVFLEDYALLAKGALSLYEVTLDVTYLDFAKELMTSAISKYKNESGLFYYNTSSALVPKIINTSDGVVPSANAIMGQNLFKLGHLEYNTDYLEHVALMGSLLVDEFERQPINYGTWGSLLLSQVYPFYEVAVVGDNAKALVTELGGFYLANTLVVGSTTSSDIALFKDRYSEEETFVYVCQNNTCKLPVKTAKEAYGQMKLFGYPGVE